MIEIHVYCTDCEHFRCEDEHPYCEFEDKCEIRNCEDSMLFQDRPYYVGRKR